MQSNSHSTIARVAMLFVCKLTLIWVFLIATAHAQSVGSVFKCGTTTTPGDSGQTCYWFTTIVSDHEPRRNEQDAGRGGGSGGGGPEKGNPGEPNGKKDPKKDCVNASGNPIIYSTGNKIEPETDFVSQGDMGLALDRTYNNYWDGIGIFGKNWLSDFDYKLAFNTDATTGTCYPKPGATCTSPPTNITTFWAMRPDGLQIEYDYNATQGVWWEKKASPISRIVRNTDGSYTLYGEDHNVEHYSASGYVLSVTTEQGVGWTFTYDANNYLQRVSHTSGRYMQFTWTSGQLTSVTDPQGNQYSYTYLANRAGTGLNLLRTATLPGSSPTTVTYYYEDTRFPFGLTGKDYNGVRYSTFAYDAAGHATLSQHGTADKYTFAYTDPGDGTLSVLETNPLSRQTTYQFVNGNITSTTGNGGASCLGTYKTHTYDANGYDSQVTDFNGNITQYTYAANGQLQQMVEAYNTPAARTTTYQWDPDPTRNRPLSVTLVGVSKTSYTYDTLARLASVTVQNLSANGVPNQTHTTTYTYTTYPSGITQSITVDGPLPGTGDAVTSNFSSSGDLTSVTNSLSQTVSYTTYNGLGEPGHVVGVNGATVDYSYDTQGRMVDVRTYPNGVAADTTYTYDGSGLLTAITTPDGVTENSVYDGMRHLIAATTNSGTVQQEEDYYYDAMSNVTAVQDRNMVGSYQDQCTKWWRDGEGYYECIASITVWQPAGTVTRAVGKSFDGLGRLWTISGNNGQNVRTTYDANDNPATITDSLNHATTLNYDAFNRVARSVDAKGGISQFAYDAAGNLTTVTDPRGLVTTYVYDGFGQLLSQTSPDTGTTSFTYDAYGRRTGMTRADSTVTTYAYDAFGRVTSATAGGQTQTYSFDTCTNGMGRLCSASDAQGSLTRTYTPEGWVASQTSTVAGTTYTTSYAYDTMGRATSVTYPNGVVAHYTFANGQLSAMSVTVNGVTSNVATNLTYQPYGAPSGWTYGNGLVRGNNYDLDGRLTGISSTVPSNSAVVQSLTYQFDANNTITGLTNGVNTALTQSFGYDELIRLNAVTSGSGNWSFGYDVDGNRTSHTSSAGSVTYSNSTTNNTLMALSGASTRTFGFDTLGNRVSDSGSALSFHYDPFNRMDSSTHSGVATSYRVNPLGQRTYKSTGTVWTHFVYASDSTLLTENSGTGMTDYLWMGDTLVGMVRNNMLYAIHTDHLGRPEMVTSPTQTIVWRASNYAFDRAITQDNIGGLNVGFPGQYYDSETGLWNNGFRDYDASVGRYVESDPLGLAAGINTFAYVGADPTKFVDSSGLDFFGKCTAQQYLKKYGGEAWRHAKQDRTNNPGPVFPGTPQEALRNAEHYLNNYDRAKSGQWAVTGYALTLGYTFAKIGINTVGGNSSPFRNDWPSVSEVKAGLEGSSDGKNGGGKASNCGCSGK
jgi:RHS repeat-associated protein